MLILSIVFILLILVYIVRISNNNDIIKKNIKTEEDKLFIKEVKKAEHKTKVSIVLFISAIIILIIFLICDLTNYDYIIYDYFAIGFVEELEFDRLLYFVPAYIVIANVIYTQVNIGDKLLKYFKTKEEELEINIDKEKILSFLYKKKPTSTEEKKSEN